MVSVAQRRTVGTTCGDHPSCDDHLGWAAALAADPALAAGLSTHRGALHSLEVAHDLGLPYTEPGALLPA